MTKINQVIDSNVCHCLNDRVERSFDDVASKVFNLLAATIKKILSRNTFIDF